MYYYDIHVFFSRNNGYSFGLITETEMGEDEAIAEAVKQKLFSEEGDEKNVDIVDEVSKEEYSKIYD